MRSPENFVVPGEKLCLQCRHKLASNGEPAEEDVEISDTEDGFEENFPVEPTTIQQYFM